MRPFLLAALLGLSLACLPAFGQADNRGMPLGETPSLFLVGGSRGLYRAELKGGEIALGSLWEGGSVSQLLHSAGGWYIVGSRGVAFSADLTSFQDRSEGLPRKILKVEEGGAFTLAREMVDITSFAIDPARRERLAASTATEVWYSDNAGKSWRSLGAPTPMPGLKAVGFGPWNGSSRHGVWVSHGIKGVFAIDAEAGMAAASGWTPMNAGLPKVFNANFEEVSGFALIPTGTSGAAAAAGQGAAPGAAAGGSSWAFLAGLSFKGAILQWDQAAKSFVERYSDGADFGAVESRGAAAPDAGRAFSRGMAQRFFLPAGMAKLTLRPDAWLTGAANAVAEALASQCGDIALCLAWIPPAAGQNAPRAGSSPVVLNALAPPGAENGGGEAASRGEDPATLRRALAGGKDGLYLQTGFVVNKAAREKYMTLATSLGLNSIVADMKDDSGKLRFSPRSPALAGMDNGGEPLDIEGFAEEAHRRGLYLIARVVVFKDEALYRRDNGALALRDAASGLPWRGLKQDGQPNQEFWVDPYSPEVWRYNVEIAKEVTARGFDEVQFDYIRFPTDGTNLASARFPAIVPGMSQEAALESFLRFARKNLEAPIGVDIYGYNGWYRTGAGTGQNLEMLAKYVDVVSPMFYPSHFEQGFQAQAPAEQRPYRIYKLGTLRASSIARGKALIRPYVQAFYLDVSYDQTYYGKKYVLQEIRGVRGGVDQGMTFWNNAGRYDDLVGTYGPPAH
jgi:hypothetical protein